MIEIQSQPPGRDPMAPFETKNPASVTGERRRSPVEPFPNSSGVPTGSIVPRDFDPSEPFVLGGNSGSPVAEVDDPKISRRGLLGLLAGFSAAAALGAYGLNSIHEGPIPNGEKNETPDDAETLMWQSAQETLEIFRKAMGELIDEPIVPEVIESEDQLYGAVHVGEGEVRNWHTDSLGWVANFRGACSLFPGSNRDPEYVISLFASRPNEDHPDSMPNHGVELVVGGPNGVLEEKFREGTLTPREVLDCVGGDGQNGWLGIVAMHGAEFNDTVPPYSGASLFRGAWFSRVKKYSTNGPLSILWHSDGANGEGPGKAIGTVLPGNKNYQKIAENAIKVIDDQNNGIREIIGV